PCRARLGSGAASRRRASSLPPQQHVERAGAAVLRLRPGAGEHARAQIALVEPARHRLAQHASSVAEAAFAGDHQHRAQAILVRAADEAYEGTVLLLLDHSMEIEPRFHVEPAAPEFLG